MASGRTVAATLTDRGVDDAAQVGPLLDQVADPVASLTGGGAYDRNGAYAEVHERQHYRLTSWKRGAAELTYRRFFDVSTLAAVRVEDPDVFAATHGEVLAWVGAGDVDGLRVDHPDGLSDPGGYMRRLRAAIGPDRWLLVEKILGVGEELPVSWPVDGTSGYEALREICVLIQDPTEPHESAHDLDVDVDRARGAQQARKHRDSLLGEGARRLARSAPT